MIVREASDADVRHVIGHLRRTDRQEQFATRFDDDADALVNEIIRLRPLAIKHYALACDDGEPAILVAAYLVSPKVARFHMASTDRMGEIARAGHRWGLQRFIPSVLMPNVRRAEARILADHTIARRWVAACGFVEEGVIRRVGRAGEDFVQVVWFNPGEPQ